MTNWVAGHVHRFGAIVTHAGLWALDQQHKTTDAAQYKTNIFGEPGEHPEWYAANSPHRRPGHPDADARRPRQPRLPGAGQRGAAPVVGPRERLRRPPEGAAAPVPAATGENHWVLSPANAEIWYDTVLGFCAQHVLKEPWEPSALL